MERAWQSRLALAAAAAGSSLIVWQAVGMETVYENFDGPYYAVVAKTFYDKPEIARQFAFPLPLEYYAAHLPGYPLVMAILGLSGINLLTAGLIASASWAVGTCLLLHYIYLKMGIKHAAWLALAWLFVWPRMWAVRSIISPEAMFVGLAYLSLWRFEKKKYWQAGLAGAAATLVKSPGLLLLPTFGIYLAWQWWRTKKVEWKAWPAAALVVGGFVGLMGFYYWRTGDWLAYFNSGDNHHLMWLPWGVFNASLPWVGTFWLEEILWVYLLGGAGVWLAWGKNKLWAIYGAVFLTVIMFVAHRDVARYSLPLVPAALLGVADWFKHKWVKIGLLAWLVPCLFYTLNFMSHNRLEISDWQPFFLFSK